MSSKRFRIAFSFAGEKRDFVKQVADLLAKRFGLEAILYDKYHEAEFANADLAFDLPAFYKSEADLIVSVFCHDYWKKEWCGCEWRAIFSIIKEGGSKQVMLSRFDHVDGQGLFGLGGFVELDHKTPEAFATLILERLAINEGKPRDHYHAASSPSSFSLSTSIPHNLPRLDAFFGREKELADIARALDPKSGTWGTLIDGDSGIGKTSLAIRAAYNASPNHFRRIIFFSLKEHELYDDGVRSRGGLSLSCWMEILDEMARKLDRSEITKAPDHERSCLLHEALRDQHVLLVLDNLESLTKDEQSQLFEFLNVLPNDCKAILTSREFFGNKVHALKLLEFDQPHALELLEEIAHHNRTFAKATEAERIALYKQTNGNPLLLRWVASQIGTGHCTCLADALDHLRSCPEGNDALKFVFGHLLTAFNPADIKILAALSFPSQPIPIKAIAEISGVATDYVRKHLKVFTNRSLVVPYQDEKEYSLVPMVADFLQMKKREVVQETGGRLERRAYELIKECGYHNHANFPALEAAWPSITPALALFLIGDNQRLQTVCKALQNFLNFQGRWDEWLALSEKAEARAVAAADYYNAGWRAYHTGVIHFQRRQAEVVLTCAERAAAHWVLANAGARDRAIAISLRGLGHRLKGNSSAAITAYREVLDLHRSIADENADVSIGLTTLADAEQESGDFDAAERHYREAISVSLALDDTEGAAISTCNLASLALDRKDWPAAETFAREALPLSEKVHHQELIATNNRHLAKALLLQGKAAEALSHAQRAVDIYARLDSHHLADAQAVLNECEAAVP